jgi:hypothetical protein
MSDQLSPDIRSYKLFVKKDCPTCELITSTTEAISAALGDRIKIFVQDDPSFLSHLPNTVDDSELESSYKDDITIVPTITIEGHPEVRIEGWDRVAWQKFFKEENAVPEIGVGLPNHKPGCGSKTLDAGMSEKLKLRYADPCQARKIELSDDEDDIESCFERGWTDGLPVVPPTPLRVVKMLAGTDRDPSDVIGNIPPDNSPLNIEKLAINAVMAGCKPEYMPLVIASVEAALQEKFCMHGLLCTTYFSSPVMIINGPVAKHLNINSGVNALGQGRRANATIGRTLQLIIRNIGGGVPGGIDRAVMGNPGKYTYCFAEDESQKDWPTLAEDQGYDRGKSVISLFAGEGLQPILDQQSRNPDSLSKSMANSLRAVVNTKLYGLADAILIVCPEHRRVFRQAGWKKSDLHEAISKHLLIPGTAIARGVDGIAEGMPEKLKDRTLAKFRPGGLHIVTTGGTAGMFSAIISGWVASGERGSQLVSQIL